MFQYMGTSYLICYTKSNVTSFCPNQFLDPIREDLSLPQVILVESMWICGFHGQSMVFFLAVETLKFGFSVHGLSMENPHETINLFNFHGINADSLWIPHGLSPQIIHALLNKLLVLIISCNPLIPCGLSLH